MRIATSLLIVLSLIVLVSESGAETPAALLARAKKLHQSGVMMEAVNVYKQYLEQVPGDTEARVGLVELLLSLERKEEAIPHIQIVRGQKPNDPKVKQFARIADEYLSIHRKSQIEQYEEQVKDPKVNPKIILEYARYLGSNSMSTRAIELYRRYLESNPHDADARFELAQQYAWSNQYRASRQELNVVLKDNPRDLRARRLIGDIIYWQGDEDGALVQYEEALKIRPNDRETQKRVDKIKNTPGYKEKQLILGLKQNPYSKLLVELAVYYLEVGRDFEAESLVQKRLQADPEDEEALKIAIEIESRKQKRLEKQIGEYEKKLEKTPKDSLARLRVARFYASKPDFETALIHFDKYLQQYPLDYRVRLERAQIMNWSGKSSDAIAEYRVVMIALPDNKEAKIGLAQALLIENQSLKEAEKIFRDDLKANPGNLHSKIGYGDALRRQGKYPEAKEVYLEVLKVDSTNVDAQNGLVLLDQDFAPLILNLEGELKNNPDDVNLKNRLAGLYFDAQRYYEAEQLVQALLEKDPENAGLKAFLTRIIQQKNIYQSEKLLLAKQKILERPDDIDARIAYAEILAATGLGTEAIAQFELILESRPDDQALAVKLAELLVESKSIPSGAQIYSRLADENPANYSYRYRYAVLLSWIGDNDKAIEEYNRALRLDPQSVDCQIGIANAYRWKGDLYEAHDLYSRILLEHPNNIAAKRGLRDLNGALFRGVDLLHTSASDNETFELSETRVSAIASLSLKSRVRAGSGSVRFSQSDRTRRYTFSEAGYFLFIDGQYNFDKLTQGSASVRYYVFERESQPVIVAEIAHIFDDVPELKGLVGGVGYSTHFAVFHVASTRSLDTWNKSFTSEKFTLWGNYVRNKKWLANAQLDYISISDGNARSDLSLEGGMRLRQYFSFGGRYENISADKEVTDYWSPANYETISGWAKLGNSFPRWSYGVTISAGQVLSTNDSIRRLSFDTGYRVSTRVNISGSFLSLRTVRQDGAYSYKGISLSMMLNF